MRLSNENPEILHLKLFIVKMKLRYWLLLGFFLFHFINLIFNFYLEL